MAKKRPYSKVVTGARADLAAIAADLRVIKARALGLERRLSRAAMTGDVIGTRHDNGEPPRPYTVEEFLAGRIYGDVFEVGGALDDAIHNFTDHASDNLLARAQECLLDLDGTLI